jgi:hypothetical protein
MAHHRLDAAAALGVSDDFFDEYIRPDLCAIYIGSLVLYAVTELQRWLDDHAMIVGKGTRIAGARLSPPPARQQELRS